MDAKIASSGEERQLELREVLVRILRAANEASRFASNKLDGCSPAEKAELAKDLWNGREPHFTWLMESFHRAKSDAWTLADKNRDAWYFVYEVPPITRRNSDTRYVRQALIITARVSNDWLSVHPEVKIPLLERLMGRLLSKRLGVIIATLITMARYIHYWWWVFRGKKIADEND
jgi:hypothetical protein